MLGFQTRAALKDEGIDANGDDSMQQYRSMAQEASMPLPVCWQQMGLEHSNLPSITPIHEIKERGFAFPNTRIPKLPDREHYGI